MARQKGIIRLKGTVGGVNFYNNRYGDLARESGGGFDSNSSKKYPRIKENNDEMGMASKVNKVFKRSFMDLCLGYKVDRADKVSHLRRMKVSIAK